jgi:hypothetical protein
MSTDLQRETAPSEQGSALLGDPIPGSCESRFPLLRNARVAEVQFLISVTVRGAGGDGVKRPTLHDGIAAWPTSAGSARRHSLERNGRIGRIAPYRTYRMCLRACTRNGP